MLVSRYFNLEVLWLALNEGTSAGHGPLRPIRAGRKRRGSGLILCHLAYLLQGTILKVRSRSAVLGAQRLRLAPRRLVLAGRSSRTARVPDTAALRCRMRALGLQSNYTILTRTT